MMETKATAISQSQWYCINRYHYQPRTCYVSAFSKCRLVIWTLLNASVCRLILLPISTISALKMHPQLAHKSSNPLANGRQLWKTAPERICNAMWSEDLVTVKYSSLFQLTTQHMPARKSISILHAWKIFALLPSLIMHRKPPSSQMSHFSGTCCNWQPGPLLQLLRLPSTSALLLRTRTQFLPINHLQNALMQYPLAPLPSAPRQTARPLQSLPTRQNAKHRQSTTKDRNNLRLRQPNSPV